MGSGLICCSAPPGDGSGSCARGWNGSGVVHWTHRVSLDADHVLVNLRDRFDQILAEIESVAGCQTNRLARPVQILGSLDGIDTGIWQLIRSQPLETTLVYHDGRPIRVPTQAEILRIKAALILKRNAVRDYLDTVALADHLGPEGMIEALRSLDSLYPQENGNSALLQLEIQLSNPMPYDLAQVNLIDYKGLKPRWHSWETVKAACASMSKLLFDNT